MDIADLSMIFRAVYETPHIGVEGIARIFVYFTVRKCVVSEVHDS